MISLDIDKENKVVAIHENMTIGELIEMLDVADPENLEDYLIVVKAIEEDILMESGFMGYPENADMTY